MPALKLEAHQRSCLELSNRKRRMDELAFVKVAPVVDIGMLCVCVRGRV